MKIHPQIFLLSDLHYGHAMAKFGVRPDNFSEVILENWNKVVSKKDTVLCLGDLTMANKEKSIEYFKKFNGSKYLILGNHDGHGEQWYNDCGFTVIEPIFKTFKDKYGNYMRVFFTHEPVVPLPIDVTMYPEGDKYYYFNIHGHLHGGKHHEYNTTDRHFDMSAECVDYTPMPLYKILDIFKKEIGGEVNGR